VLLTYSIITCTFREVPKLITAEKMSNNVIDQRGGDWLPKSSAHTGHWLRHLVRNTNENKPLHPVLSEFQNMIEDDSKLYMLATAMFDEVPNKPPYNEDPEGEQQVRDFDHCLQLMNTLLTVPPKWSQKAEDVGLIGCPFNAVLDWYESFSDYLSTSG